MSNETQLLLEKAVIAKLKYKLGNITREQARLEIEPYITHYNEKSKSIAKKYNQKPKTISFISFIR